MALPMCSEVQAIRAEGLGKTYRIYDRPVDRLKQLVFGGRRMFGRAFAALSDVSFDLPKGQVLGVVGNNGAGKSTLLQLLCGTLTPSAGHLEVNGRVAALLELGAGFNPEFTGRENIFLNAAVLGLSQAEIEARYEDIVAFSGIGEFIQLPVKTYSSGMYVRLAFSIATSVEPDILVIDEALSVGDGAFARKSFDRIMELRDKGATILFCSHSMYQIEAICDKALWLERGRVRMLGNPEVVTRAYAASLLPPLPDGQAGAEPAPSGHAALVSVRVSSAGVVGRQFRLRPGDSLLVAVRFRFDPALPLPAVAFGVETFAGVAISSGSTSFDKVAPRVIESGEAEVLLEFVDLPLMRGRYRLTVFLACERSIHVYDQALYCAELEMVHEGVEQGVCFLPHRWNYGPVCVVS